MKHHRRKVVKAGAVLAFVAGSVGLAIQVDSYMLERRAKMAQMRYQQQVMDCESMGMRWYRGSCLAHELGP